MFDHSSRVRNAVLVFVATGLLATGIITVAGVAQQMPADLDPASGARLGYLTRQDLGDAGSRLSDIFARNGGPTDPVSGPLAFAAYNIPVANALLDLHDGAVGTDTLDAHARELAIMVASRETNYSLEWNGHLQAALNAGVDQNVLDVVLGGQALSGISDEDAAVIRFGRELMRESRLSSETYNQVAQEFGEEGLVTLTFLMGNYVRSALMLRAADMRIPLDREPLLPLTE